MSKLLLQLFIAGRTPQAERAISTLRHVITQYLGSYECELVVVDVLTDPLQAEERHILATPTLLKVSPLPQRRIIGDLSDTHGLLAALNLSPDQS